MGAIRWAIIAAGQVCALVLIVCITIAGAIVGYSISNGQAILKSVSIYHRLLLYDTLPLRDPGLWVGGLIGLLISLLIAAIFFSLVEIAKNTSEQWFQ